MQHNINIKSIMDIKSNKIAKKKLLFICLGNICRSPAAHAVMQKLVNDKGLTSFFEIDSAGIGNWHIGELPDKRMRIQGAKRNYNIDHHARQFDAKNDFAYFDAIIVMDDENYKNIIAQTITNSDKMKVMRMADYFIKYKGTSSVPDPYYGGVTDFDYALDLIEDGCEGLLQQLNK